MHWRALGIALGLSLATPAWAGGRVSRVSPDDVVRSLEGTATLVKRESDAKGTPFLLFSAGGQPFGVFFYGCDPHPKRGMECADVQLRAAWEEGSVDADLVSSWNARYRTGRAYVSPDGRPTFEVVVRVHPGVTRDWLEARVGKFVAALAVVRREWRL